MGSLLTIVVIDGSSVSFAVHHAKSQTDCDSPLLRKLYRIEQKSRSKFHLNTSEKNYEERVAN